MFSVPVYWLIVLIIRVVPRLLKQSCYPKKYKILICYIQNYRWRHYITITMLGFPVWKFMILGLLDSLQGILGFFSDSHVPGENTFWNINE